MAGARLLRVWPLSRLTLELHLTPDVVAFAPRSGCDALLYGANERLEGARFSPSESHRLLPGNRRESGGGHALLYPEQSVDGQVSDAGGVTLRALLNELMPPNAPAHAPWATAARVRAGCVVRTAATGSLVQNYAALLHACPPRYDDSSVELDDAIRRRASAGAGGAPPPPSSAPAECAGLGSERARARRWLLLSRCYLRAFELAWLAPARPLPIIAAPLLGAGARGFPIPEAAAALARAAVGWRPARAPTAPSAGERVLCVGVQDEDVADAVVAAMARATAPR
jgi:hypothetical protein